MTKSIVEEVSNTMDTIIKSNSKIKSCCNIHSRPNKHIDIANINENERKCILRILASHLQNDDINMDVKHILYEYCSNLIPYKIVN